MGRGPCLPPRGQSLELKPGQASPQLSELCNMILASSLSLTSPKSRKLRPRAPSRVSTSTMVSTWCQHGVNMCVNRLAGLASTGGGGKGRAGGQYLCEPSTGRPWKCVSPSTGQPSMRGNMFGGVHMGFLEMSTGVHSTLLPP